jgi:hypothetical protein
MDGAIGMPVLVGVDVRVDVGMGVFVLDDLGRHDLFLLGAGEKSAAIAALGSDLASHGRGILYQAAKSGQPMGTI